MFLLSEEIFNSMRDMIGNDCGDDIWMIKDANNMGEIFYSENFDSLHTNDIDLTDNLVEEEEEEKKEDNKDDKNTKKIKTLETKINKIDEELEIIAYYDDNAKIIAKLENKKNNYETMKNKLCEKIKRKKDAFKPTMDVKTPEDTDDKRFQEIEKINGTVLNKDANNYRCELIFKLLNDKTLKIIENEDNKQLIILRKFYNCVYSHLYSNYMDLDKYDGITYNILATKIIDIMRVNMVDILKYELYYALMYELSENLEQKYNTSNLPVKATNDMIIIKMIYNLLDKTMLKQNDLLENEEFDEESSTSALVNKIIELSEIKETSNEDKKDDSSSLFALLRKYVDFYKTILSQISTNLLNEINNVLELLKINALLVEIAYDVKIKSK